MPKMLLPCSSLLRWSHPMPAKSVAQVTAIFSRFSRTSLLEYWGSSICLEQVWAIGSAVSTFSAP